MKTLSRYVNKALSSIRKWRWRKSADRYFDSSEGLEESLEQKGLKVIDQDAMPPETATERLCEVKVRMTGTERRMFERARWRILVPIHPARKPLGRKLLRRFEARPLATLHKWYRRSEARRRGIQKRYEILVTMEENPATLKEKRILDMRAAAMDLALDVIGTVVEWRSNLAKGQILKPEMVGVLRDPLRGRQLIWTESLETQIAALGESERVKKTEFPRWVTLKTK